jgi:hypothetical protein
MTLLYAAGRDGEMGEGARKLYPTPVSLPPSRTGSHITAWQITPGSLCSVSSDGKVRMALDVWRHLRLIACSNWPAHGGVEQNAGS